MSQNEMLNDHDDFSLEQKTISTQSNSPTKKSFFKKALDNRSKKKPISHSNVSALMGELYNQ